MSPQDFLFPTVSGKLLRCILGYVRAWLEGMKPLMP
jgi:hypothetical protein